jgi:hypothetical protein
MILVIFGAGASYDSIPSRPPSQYIRAQLASRLPLAKELFLTRGVFSETLSYYPQCHPIVPYLQVDRGQCRKHAGEITTRSG